MLSISELISDRDEDNNTNSVMIDNLNDSGLVNIPRLNKAHQHHLELQHQQQQLDQQARHDVHPHSNGPVQVGHLVDDAPVTLTNLNDSVNTTTNTVPNILTNKLNHNKPVQVQAVVTSVPVFVGDVAHRSPMLFEIDHTRDNFWTLATRVQESFAIPIAQQTIKVLGIDLVTFVMRAMPESIARATKVPTTSAILIELPQYHQHQQQQQQQQHKKSSASTTTTTTTTTVPNTTETSPQSTTTTNNNLTINHNNNSNIANYDNIDDDNSNSDDSASPRKKQKTQQRQQQRQQETTAITLSKNSSNSNTNGKKLLLPALRAGPSLKPVSDCEDEPGSQGRETYDTRMQLTALLNDRAKAITLDIVAHMTNFSASAISLWRRGAYKGNNKTVTHAVLKVLSTFEQNQYQYIPALHDGSCIASKRKSKPKCSDK